MFITCVVIKVRTDLTTKDGKTYSYVDPSKSVPMLCLSCSPYTTLRPNSKKRRSRCAGSTGAWYSGSDSRAVNDGAQGYDLLGERSCRKLKSLFIVAARFWDKSQSLALGPDGQGKHLQRRDERSTVEPWLSLVGQYSLWLSYPGDRG